MAIVSAVALAGVGAFSARMTTLELERIDVPLPRASAENIRGAIAAYHARKGSWVGLTPEIERLASSTHTRILVLNRQGTLLAASDPGLRTTKVSLLSDGTVRLISESAASVAAPRQEQIDLTLRGPSATIRGPSGTTAALVYVMPQPDLMSGLPGAELALQARRMIWIGVAFASLTAMLAAFVLSTHVLRPITSLTAAARRLARGETGARVTVKSHDELGELAGAFNSMAESLERLERMRKDLVADVAHELRTPLTNIRGYIEAMQDGRVEASPAALGSLHDDVMLLQQLVADLHDLSLADADQLRIAPVALDLRGVINSSIDAFPPGHARITADIPEGLPLVSADPARLSQIMRNVLANALAHVSVGGSVSVSASRNGEKVRVRVENDGQPIDTPDLALIFERFYRSDKSRTRATGGAGLGLAIVKQFVNAHGGQVHALNTDAPGVAIEFTLPIA
jgi:signal transduction histidine kinase